jgi:hypothetical protein
METKKVICRICKNEFWARGSRAKYCSPECRKLTHYGKPRQDLHKKVRRNLKATRKGANLPRSARPMSDTAR